MDDLDRESPYFEGLVPFKLNLSDRDQKQTELTVRVLPGTRAGGARQRVICIEVTDESDPYFHHSFSVDEAGFADLRTDQAILVDFNQFPGMFIELLQQSVDSKQAAQQRFCCVLHVRDPSAGAPSLLSMVETNHFKQLTHIQLKLTAGNDTTVKRYLAARLSQTKTALSKTRAALDGSTAEASRLRELTTTTGGELSRIRSEYESREASLRIAHATEVSDAREAGMRAVAAAEEAHRQTAVEAAARHGIEVQGLQRQLNEAQAVITQLRSHNGSLDAALRETRAKLEAASADLALAREELSRSRSIYREVDEQKTQGQRELSATSTRVAVLEQQVADQKELLARTQALLAASEASKASMEESLGLYKSGYNKLTEKLEASVAEINKGNAVITKLQDEYKAAKAKGKGKAEALHQIEERLADRERAFLQLQREMDTLRMALDKESSVRQSSDGTVSSLKQQLDAARETIADNQQVIAWLNKELNERASSGSIPVQQRTLTGSGIVAGGSSRIPVSASFASSKAMEQSGAMSSTFLRTIPAASSPNSQVLSSTARSTALPAPMDRTGSEPSRSPPGGNPYLSGTVPLAQAIANMNSNAKTSPSAYFSAANSSGINPGGAPFTQAN